MIQGWASGTTQKLQRAPLNANIFNELLSMILTEKNKIFLPSEISTCSRVPAKLTSLAFNCNNQILFAENEQVTLIGNGPDSLICW